MNDYVNHQLGLEGKPCAKCTRSALSGNVAAVDDSSEKSSDVPSEHFSLVSGVLTVSHFLVVGHALGSMRDVIHSSLSLVAAQLNLGSCWLALRRMMSDRMSMLILVLFSDPSLAQGNQALPTALHSVPTLIVTWAKPIVELLVGPMSESLAVCFPCVSGLDRPDSVGLGDGVQFLQIGNLLPHFPFLLLPL